MAEDKGKASQGDGPGNEEEDELDEQDDADDTSAEESPPAAAPPLKAASKARPAPPPAELDEPEAVEKVRVRTVVSPAPAASLGKSVSAFMTILVVLAAGFWFLGTAESPFGKQGQPKWKIGDTIAIVLTLDPKDDDNLACASDANIGGKRCEFKSKTEKTDGKLDDATTLKPYKTTADEPLLAAGVWSSPEIAKGKRPNGRFNYKCQFKVEAKVQRPQVRWSAMGQFGDQEVDWFAGSVSNCVVEK